MALDAALARWRLEAYLQRACETGAAIRANDTTDGSGMSSRPDVGVDQSHFSFVRTATLALRDSAVENSVAEVMPASPLPLGDFVRRGARLELRQPGLDLGVIGAVFQRLELVLH